MKYLVLFWSVEGDGYIRSNDMGATTPMDFNESMYKLLGESSEIALPNHSKYEKARLFEANSRSPESTHYLELMKRTLSSPVAEDLQTLYQEELKILEYTLDWNPYAEVQLKIIVDVAE